MSRPDSLWLDVRAGINDELFLQECHRPYIRGLWSHNKQKPQILAFIGCGSKNISMYKLFSLSSTNVHDKVHLRLIPTTEAGPSPILIADCELHNASQLQKVSGGPVPGDIDQRSISWHKKLPTHDPKAGVKAIANLVYAQLISPFSSVICIFADDIGGTHCVAGMLASWLRNSRPRHLHPAVRPRVLILVRWDDSLAEDFDEDFATTAFIEELGQKPARLTKHFGSLRVLALPALDQERPRAQDSWTTLQERILQDATAVQALKQTSRMTFGASHLKTLIHSACNRFATDLRAPFCTVTASRYENPVPPMLATHLVNFIQLVNAVSPSRISDFAVPVIASALVLDSYPPGMHRFYADEVFDILYEPILKSVRQTLLHCGYELSLDHVKSLYCAQVDGNTRRSIASAASHRQILALFTEDWKGCYSNRVCLACTARFVERSLSCRHILCETCIMIHGRPAADDPCYFTIRQCPLCQVRNSAGFHVKPETAGIRGLSIGGVDHTLCRATFLGLQRELKLTSSSLPDHFDIVVGTGPSATLILGVFCKAWPVERCLDEYRQAAAAMTSPTRLLYKLRNLRRTRRPSHGSTPLGSETLVGSSMKGTKIAIAVTGKDDLPYFYSNYNGPGRPAKKYDHCYSMIRPSDVREEVSISDLAAAAGSSQFIRGYKLQDSAWDSLIRQEQDFIWSRAGKEPDALIYFEASGTATQPAPQTCGEDRHSPSLLPPQINNETWQLQEYLLPALFYIRLVGPPVLDGYRLICDLQISCRWGPSPALQNLTKRLLDSQARFCYGPGESILCVDPALYEMEKNEPIAFSRRMFVIVLSRDELIDVKLECPSYFTKGRVSVTKSISNCPYNLRCLIHDQGLDCCFGRSDHKATHI